MLSTLRTFQRIVFTLYLSGVGVVAAVGFPQAPGAATVIGVGEEKIAAPIPFPDGVIDSERRTAYVTSPRGGIQAIRLDDGKVLWTNDACAAQPWLVAENRLIARAERILILDLKNDGKILRQCDGLEFPKVNVPERCTVSFPLWNPRVVGDTLEANWYAVAHIDRSKGRPFPFQGWTAFNKAVPIGMAKINLKTGRAMVQTEVKPADVTGALMPEEAKPGRQVPSALAEKLATVWRQYHKDQNGRITTLNDRLVGIEVVLEKLGQEYQKRVVLNAWELKTGAAVEPVELVKDKALNIANIVLTEDRRHVAVVFNNSTLTIYSLANPGKFLAKDVKGIVSAEQAFIHDKRIYFSQLTGRGAKETPTTLKALDLDSGKVAWERDLKARSTFPLAP